MDARLDGVASAPLAGRVLYDHRRLTPAAASLLRLAEACDDERPGAVATDVDAALTLLEDVVLPRVIAEDEVLGAVVGWLLGEPEQVERAHATVAEVQVLMAALWRQRGLLWTSRRPAAVREIGRLLRALHSAIVVHLRTVEDVQLPQLQAELTPLEQQELLDRLDAAVRRVAPGPAGR